MRESLRSNTCISEIKFFVTENLLVLIPKNSVTKNFISEIKVLLRKDSRIPQIIEFIEVSGDRTVMNIVNFSENTKLPMAFDETKIEEFIYPQK